MKVLLAMPFAVWFLLAVKAVADVDDDEDLGLDAIDEADDADEAGAAEAEEASRPDVAQLSAFNFDTYIKTHERVWVDFYSESCDHCKALDPEWALAAKELRAEGLSTRFARVDVIKEAKLNKYVTGGYPTMLTFINGKRKEHLKDLKVSAAEIWRRARRDELAVLKEIPESDVSKFFNVTHKGVMLLARVKPKSVRAKAYLKTFEEFKRLNITLRMGVVWLPDTGDAKADASLVMVRIGFEAPDERSLDYKGAWSAGNIVKWARAGLYGTVNRFFNHEVWTLELMREMGEKGLVLALVAENNSDPELKSNLLQQLEGVSKSFHGWQSMILDVNELLAGPGGKDIMSYFNPRGTPAPLLSAIMWDRGSKHALSGIDELTKPDAVKKLIVAAQKNQLKSERRSASPPAKPLGSDGVTTLVADSLEDVTLDPTKDAVVLYSQAADCEPCRTWDPVWQDLGRKAMSMGLGKRGVVIAKVDTAENEVDEETTTIPKIVLYPAVKKERKLKDRAVYSGPPELVRVLQFIKDSSKAFEDDDGEL